jgi:glutathione S-transferase
MTTITLHHCVSARSLRPLWMLEEIGLPYELKMWPFPPRALDRSYFEVNPLGTVPTMVSGEIRMTESVAICQYLAARHSAGVFDVSVEEPEYGAYLNYLHFGEATLTFPQTLVLRYSRFESADRRLPSVADDYTKWFLARLRILGPRMEAREFVCADRFTAADVSVGYALLLGEHLNLNERFPSSVQAYWARLKERPAYLRALQAQQRAAIAQGVSPAAPSIEA